MLHFISKKDSHTFYYKNNDIHNSNSRNIRGESSVQINTVGRGRTWTKAYVYSSKHVASQQQMSIDVVHNYFSVIIECPSIGNALVTLALG